MSEPTNPPPPQEESLGLDKYLASLKSAIKRVRDFDYKKLFQDIVTFLSIITAYFAISLSYQFPGPIQKLFKINLQSSDTLFTLALSFSCYLILWKTIGNYLKARALTPPPKKEEFDEEIPMDEPEVPVVLQPLPNGEQYAHDIIYDSLKIATYFFLMVVSVCSYAYLNQPKVRRSLPPLVTIQRLNYIGLWFLAANSCYLLGGITAKITKMGEFKVLGVAMAVVVGVLTLGLAQQINTFIFI